MCIRLDGRSQHLHLSVSVSVSASASGVSKSADSTPYPSSRHILFAVFCRDCNPSPDPSWTSSAFILLWSLVPIDPSNNSPFLQHSVLSHSESTLQISKCGFRSVPPNLVRHASLVQIRIRKARSLARLTKYFVASVKSNLSWSNQFAPCPVNLIQILILSPVQSYKCCLGFGIIESSLCCASCDLHPGVLTVFLHCRFHTLFWIVEQCCVVFASTQCRIRLPKFFVVFNTSSVDVAMF